MEPVRIKFTPNFILHLMASVPTAIYGLVDSDDQIRYVGKSINPASRFRKHKQTFYWIDGLSYAIKGKPSPLKGRKQSPEHYFARWGKK